MKLIYLLALSVLATSLNAQKISSSRWSDLFSYNNVLQIREDNGKLVAATENGIFYYTISTGEITKLSKANGLHEVKISAFDYNPDTKIGLVGYANGTLDVITENGITYVVDIPIATSYSGSRKINHISITGNRAVISAGYGVSVFDLEKKEFRDTAFFITNGTYTPAKEATIVNDIVYAVTSTGLKMHAIDVSFPVYSTWTNLANGDLTNIASSGNVVAYSNANSIFVNTGSGFNQLPTAFTTINDIVVKDNSILVSEANKTSVVSTTGSVTKQVSSTEVLNTSWLSNNQLFLGTRFAGILNENLQQFKPDGPYTNTSYKISLVKNQILVSSGGRANRYNSPVFDSRNLGFYYFNGTKWIYPSYFLNNPIEFNVLDVINNPSDNKEFYFANYGGWNQNFNGFFKLKYDSTKEDFDFVKFYNSLYKARAAGLTFDDAGNLFATSSFDNEIERTTMYVYNKATDVFVGKNLGNSKASQKPIYNEGILYIPTPRSNNFAIVDLNNSATNMADDVVYLLNTNNNLPNSGEGTLSSTIDKSGDLWIGSDKGLRVMYNVASTIKDAQPELEPIIIEEKGVGEELFRDSAVLQIEADSGNQKWISIDGGGVFYLNSTGENQLLHFNKENSPLPTNSVTDIKVDEKTGKVYFVTYDGIVVYQGDVSKVTSNFGEVLVYPNPVVYANYKGNVRIKGLAEKTNIRITDAAGNLVHQAVSRGGYYEWDLTNRGKRVASGVYFVLMTNEDATDKATAKIAVVN